MTKIPTIDVYRDGKHAVINRSDLAAWQADGWGPEVAQPKEPAKPEPPKEPEPAKKPEPKQKPSK